MLRTEHTQCVIDDCGALSRAPFATPHVSPSRSRRAPPRPVQKRWDDPCQPSHRATRVDPGAHGDASREPSPAYQRPDLDCAVGTHPDGDPFVGKWKLNTARGSLTDQMSIQTVGTNTYALTFAGSDRETNTRSSSRLYQAIPTTTGTNVVGW